MARPAKDGGRSGPRCKGCRRRTARAGGAWACVTPGCALRSGSAAPPPPPSSPRRPSTALVREHLDLPRRLARRFPADCGLTYDERLSAAYYGLVAAAEAHRGPDEEFRRYAASYAWGEMRRERSRLLSRRNLGDRDGVVRDRPAYEEDPRLPVLREAMKAIPANQREVVRSLMRGEAPGGIARRMGVGRWTVCRWRDEAIVRLRERVADLVA